MIYIYIIYIIYIYYIYIYTFILLLIYQIYAVYSPGHCILKFQKVLVQVPFNTSKTELEIKYKKLHMQVASQVTERPKT